MKPTHHGGVWRHAASVAVLLYIAAAAAGFAATVYDLGTDWSDTANPNGPWSYNEGPHPLPHVEAWHSVTPAQPAWAWREVGLGFLPAWFRSQGEQYPLDFLETDWQAGDIIVHTTDPGNGGGNGPANVTWTSPIDGFVSISGGVWLARDIGRANHWGIYLNDACLTQGEIVSGDPYSRAFPFDFSAGSGGSNLLQNIGVFVGDRIKLQLTQSSINQYGEFAGVQLRLIADAEPVGGPGVKIRLHPGIRVHGSVGARYRIEYAIGLCPTNWLTLTEVELPASPHLLFDPDPAAGQTKRFYRAVEVP